MSVYTTVFVGSSPIGGLLMGGIASKFGVDVSLAVGGIACAALGLIAAWWLRRIPAPGLRRPPVPVPAERAPSSR